MSGVVIDSGTGDGAFTYQIAKRNPDRLIIDIDPHKKGLEKSSAKTIKKESRGGIKTHSLF